MKIGRIYKIIHLDSNICYVGSTFNTTRDRWREHKSSFIKYKKNKQKYGISVFKYFEQYGVERFKMILIKEYLVCDKYHLKMYEQMHINKLKKCCINRNNPFNIFGKDVKTARRHLYRNQPKITCEICKSEMVFDWYRQHIKTKMHISNKYKLNK